MCIRVYSKKIDIFKCSHVLKLFIYIVYYVKFYVSFSASIRLMLSSLKLSYMNSFKNITRKTGVVDYYN